jgi:DDE superfamily endonuclease
MGAAAPPAGLERAAAERDQDAIGGGLPSAGRRFCKRQRRRACLVFFDESALSLTPNVRRTWAPRGQTPTLTHPFNWKKASMAAALCYGARGGGGSLCFHVTAGNYDTDSLIEVLEGLRRFLGGEGHAAVGRPAVASQPCLRDWLNAQRSWLVVERLPAHAPELNPVEGLWSSLKAVELPNLATSTLGEVIKQAHRGIDRVRRTPHLAYSFLRHAGLSVS